MRPVAVIGAGVSGLAAALALERRGIPARVLEASDRVGGAVRTGRAQGYQFEHGPYTLFDNAPELSSLISQVGLGPRLQQSSKASGTRYLALHGALRAIPPGPKILSGSLLTWGARMRLLMEVVGSRARSPDETVLEFGRRHVGEEATRLLLEPFASLLYAGDVSRLSAQVCFPALIALEKRHGSLVRGIVEEYRQGKRAGAWLPVGGNLLSFPDGLEELPRAMAAALAEPVRLRAPTSRIWPQEDGVRVELASGEELSAAAVVLATPAPAASGLLAEASPAAARLLRDVSYTPLAVVHLGFAQAEVSGDLQAFGFLVPASERMPLLGCVFTSSLFPARAPAGHCLLSVILGGARSPALAHQGSDALASIAASAVRRLLGVHTEPSFAHTVVWPQAMPQYEVGTLARNASLEAALARAGPIFLAGNACEGAFLGDAARRAEQVALAVQARLGRGGARR
jgi:protoporphyrinogen/coproporphyrinogen III oxidase